MAETPTPADNSLAAEKVRSFPQTPGVYLMKDAAGRVIYVGKAKNLRARAGSYFLKAAAEDPRTAKLVLEIRDIDYLDAESEIDALLMEARLIKDILPKYNRDLRDDKTFPYLEIFTHEDFPRVRFTRGAEAAGDEALRAVRQPARPARGDPGAAKDLQVPHLHAGHRRKRQALAMVPPLPAALDRPVHGALQSAHLEGGVSQGHSPACSACWKGARKPCWPKCARRWPRRPRSCILKRRPGCGMKSKCSNRSTSAATWKRTSSPRSFRSTRSVGWPACRRCCTWPSGRGRSRASTWPTPPARTPWPRVVQFIDGLPFKPGYKRMKIRGVEGPDDVASIREAVLRRFQHIQQEGETPPDILLVDGGKGQLHAALAALASLGHAGLSSSGGVRASRTAGTRIGSQRPVVSLAKREELVFTADADEPLHLSRHSYALRLLQYVRDEAHRFAQHYHHLLRRKSQLGE